MSKIIATAPLAARSEHRAMNEQTSKSSPRADGYDEDPFALIENCDYVPPSKTLEAATAPATKDKAVGDQDEVAVPIPIATLVFQDGRTEPVYKPLAGHEHLFKAQPTVSLSTPFGNRFYGSHRLIQPMQTQVPGALQRSDPEPPQALKAKRQSVSCKQKKSVIPKQGLLKSKSLKRTRSVAQGLASNRKPSIDKEEVDDVDQTVQVVTEESHTFYIGDTDKFKEFLTHRFDELTMKPLRGIATHWVKLLEPRRLGDWGKYHEMLPSEADTPPWWPRTVIYKEPSHLKKNELSTLAVEMMLVHRELDECKRKGASWITRLRDVANFTVQTTSADHFSSSKGTEHSEAMKKRALNQILPSIFDVAQSYEDHIMQYSLFEGSGNEDPGRGKHHTWKPIPRPARQQQPKRPRRAIARDTYPSQEAICEVSGDETEPDDTMTRLARIPHLLSPRPVSIQGHPNLQTSQQPIATEDSHSQTWKIDTPVAASEPCTPATSQDDCKMYRTASTPNSSFDQSLSGLHLEEDSRDLKSHAPPVSDHGAMHPSYNMDAYTQSVQYPAAQTGFTGHVYQATESYPQPPPSSFGQHAPTFVNPFTMFNAPPPPMGYGQYASPMPTNHGYTYEQGMFSPTPMSFPNTPMSMPMTPSDQNMSFHGLSSDYAVDQQGLHYSHSS